MNLVPRLMEAAEFVWWCGVRWGGVVLVGWGLHSHFHVQPNYSIEVVLCCCWGCDNNNNIIDIMNSKYSIALIFNPLII